MNIIMLRHGESEDNLAKLYGSRATPLSEKGRGQIESIKETIRALDFTKVYVSPLKRTLDSLGVLGLEAIEEERIQEYNFGVFSGLTNDEVQVKYPIEYKAWIENPIDYIIKEGESLSIVYRRVEEFLEELLNQNEDVLLVTHAGIIRLILCWVFEEIDYFFKFKIDNGSISIVSIDDNYRFIKQLNYKPAL